MTPAMLKTYGSIPNTTDETCGNCSFRLNTGKCSKPYYCRFNTHIITENLYYAIIRDSLYLWYTLINVQQINMEVPACF